MAKTKAQKKTTEVSARETAPSDKATMVVTVYEGTRQPIQGRNLLIRIFDGFQNQLFDDDRPAPTTLFTLHFHDNLQDNYRVLVSGDGSVGAGFSPVKLSLKAVAMLDLMLLPHGADFKFQTWAGVKTTDPVVAAFISVGSSDAQAEAHYDALQKNKPPPFAPFPHFNPHMHRTHHPHPTPPPYL